MNVSEITSLIAAATALLAMIISPIVSFIITKNQISASRDFSNAQISANKESDTLRAKIDVLSKNRQDWINELRDELSFYISGVFAAAMLMIPKENDMEFLNVLKDIKYHSSKISLLLNPCENDHTQIVSIIESINSKVSNFEFDYSDKIKELTKATQIVLKREWERVKKFD